jgi:hypothetical protein
VESVGFRKQPRHRVQITVGRFSDDAVSVHSQLERSEPSRA